MIALQRNKRKWVAQDFCCVAVRAYRSATFPAITVSISALPSVDGNRLPTRRVNQRLETIIIDRGPEGGEGCRVRHRMPP
jgi:hypothetical protein